MVRESAVERSENRRFGFLVGLGYEIDRVGLVVDLGPAQAPQMDTAGRARCAERHLLESGGRRDGLRARRGWNLFDRDGVIQCAARAALA